MTNETIAIETLCNAGKYLCKSRGVSNISLNSADVRDPEVQALRIIAVALCTVKGANPRWLEALVNNPAATQL